MNVIALMPPLSLIKRLEMYVQATFVFFCVTSVVQIIFLLILISWLVTYVLLYFLLYCFKYTF